MGNKVAVIGGGASGLIAAIASAKQGAYTVLVEKNDRVGKKILSTGNGRCNFTNINAKVSDYGTDFVLPALTKYPPSRIIDFFAQIGVLPKVENEGRVYPLSAQASCVLDVLRFEAERLGVFIKTDFRVHKIEKKDDLYTLYSASSEKISCDKLIVATGGMASPKSGSCGDGYDLLKSLGHSVTGLAPSLCHIPTDKGVHGVRQHAGVSLENGLSDIGEIQFNKDNISGIPVFNISAYAKPGERISIDFLPDYDVSDVKKMLASRPCQQLETFLIGVLNKNLSLYLLKDIGFTLMSRLSDSLSDNELELLASSLKKWQMTVTGVASWDNAQVTKGGIELSEVNPETMESNICSGLYITGELLDVDAKCGGYNLQWAWASGLLAGSEASRCIE